MDRQFGQGRLVSEAVVFAHTRDQLVEFGLWMRDRRLARIGLVIVVGTVVAVAAVLAFITFDAYSFGQLTGHLLDKGNLQGAVVAGEAHNRSIQSLVKLSIAITAAWSGVFIASRIRRARIAVSQRKDVAADIELGRPDETPYITEHEPDRSCSDRLLLP
jgi:hypothetical protein